MAEQISRWVISFITSAGALALLAFLTRSTLAKFFTKSVEHHFEKKFEKFKAEIRDNEKELEQIRTFMSSARRDRDSTLQSKRFEAAESLLRARQLISEFSGLADYLKILKVDEIIKRNSDPKMTNFIKTLTDPFNIDEKLTNFKEIDRTLPNLYLSERTIKTFEAYESIILNAVTIMKLLSLPGLKIDPNLFNKEKMKNMIIDLYPQSQAGFEQYGDSYVFQLTMYFYTQILNELRNELLGTGNMMKDTEAAANLARDTRNAHMNILKSLQNNEIPESIINKPDSQ
ncbi:Uncharacterised protein [Enterobacter hormaechei]|uniref:hypothetical protein n=1 Tax=Enterobacter hormaechei TaxID=158836 RepID=UPI00079118DF|nr:hypothetical protein [Enterobacter hormaechei]CZZ44907.1 Uncharacterised protein [Enterobacter hormaechei]